MKIKFQNNRIYIDFSSGLVVKIRDPFTKFISILLNNETMINLREDYTCFGELIWFDFKEESLEISFERSSILAGCYHEN